MAKADHPGLDEMERALRESEERYKALFERMLDGFALRSFVPPPAGEPDMSR